MSELEDAFGRIRGEAERKELPMAEQLRARSDRRSRNRAVLGTLTLVALAGVTVAVLLPVIQRGTPPIAVPSGTPSVSAPVSPSPSASPSPSPSPEEEEPVGNTRCLDDFPGLIPDAAFLPVAAGMELDGGICYNVRPALPGEEVWTEPDHLPRVCATPSHASDALIADRRGMHRYLDENPDPVEISTTSYDHTVTRYTGDGAQEYLAELRQAVKRCGAFTRDGRRHDYAIVSGPRLGDESIRMTVHARYVRPQEGLPREATYYLSVVRRGSYVSVVFDQGWEGYPTRDAAIFEVMEQAARLLPAS